MTLESELKLYKNCNEIHMYNVEMYNSYGITRAGVLFSMNVNDNFKSRA